MTDPRRLIEEGATEFETALLRAGHRDAISEDGRRRVLSSLGIGAGILTSATASGATAVTKAGPLAMTGGAVFKYVGIGVAALAVWGGVHAWYPRESTHDHGPVIVEPVAPAVPSTPAVPTPGARAELEVHDPAAPIVTASPAPAGTTAPPTRRPRSADPPVERSKDSLPRELSLLDRARRELTSHHPAGALRLLDEYESSFPGGRLGAEASVLRIESLARAGDRAGLVAAGKAFLARHPDGPYATRVRSLMGENRSVAPDSPEGRR
jgi:hypothetical protein